MSEQLALQLIRDALRVTVLLAAPPLAFALTVGLLVSVLQAVTQINEVTLSFVPKILAVFISLAIFGPWMMTTMVNYATAVFNYLPELAR